MPPYLVNFGHGYSYGRSPFKNNTKITELLLPDTVTSRCDDAFAGMSGLRRLRWSSGMPFDSYNSGNYRGSTFYNCVNLSTIENLSGVTVVRSSDFVNCKFTDWSFIAWDKLTSIGGSAFQNTNIPKSIVFSKLTSVDNYWSRGSSLKEGYFPVYKTIGNQNHWEYGSLTLLDFGQNLTGTFKCSNGATHILVLRGDDYSGLTISYPAKCSRVYVHAAIYDAFVARFTSLASKTFVIGGDEWTAAYGSSDEWADYPDGKNPFEEQG